MLPVIVGGLVLVTGLMVYKAKDAYQYGEHRKFRWFAALALPLMMISIVALCLMLVYPDLSTFRFPNPFGAGWDCDNYGKGGFVCFRHQ